MLPRIQSFVWLCCHESIGVRDCLNQRGMLGDTQCPLCHASNESILHALRDCGVVKQIWLHLDESRCNSLFFNSNLQDWLETNGTNQQRVGRFAVPWSIVFSFAIWLLWKQRNLMVFKGRRPNPLLAKDILLRAFEYLSYASPTKDAVRRVCKPVCWSKPASGWVKLNTDGSSLGNSGLAGGGGLIRDEEGKWITGFACKIGKTTSFIVELWALHDGLNVCINHRFAAVEVELDAKAIIDALANLSYTNIFVSSLMDDCRLLITQIPQICFRHCYCEANRCADALARLGGSQVYDFVNFVCPPEDLVQLLDSDLHGLYLNRMCPVSVFPS